MAMACWTHNRNINHSGFSPLQLVTAKLVILPGITFSDPSIVGGFDADSIKNIILGQYSIIINYSEAQFTKKLILVSEMQR